MLYDPSLFSQNRIPNLSPPSPKVPPPDKTTRMLQELLQEMAARVESLTAELEAMRRVAEIPSKWIERNRVLDCRVRVAAFRSRIPCGATSANVALAHSALSGPCGPTIRHLVETEFAKQLLKAEPKS